MDHDTYRIRDVKTNKEYGSPVHLSRLRSYHNRELFNTKFANTTQTICKDSPTDHTTRPVHTPPTQQHEWFTVDRLQKSKLVNDQKHYLIKWRGKFPTLGNLKIVLVIIANDNLIYDAHNKVHSENNLSIQEQTSREV